MVSKKMQMKIGYISHSVRDRLKEMNDDELLDFSRRFLAGIIEKSDHEQLDFATELTKYFGDDLGVGSIKWSKSVES